MTVFVYYNKFSIWKVPKSIVPQIMLRKVEFTVDNEAGEKNIGISEFGLAKPIIFQVVKSFIR